MSTSEALKRTVDLVTELVDGHHRDMPFRAPETHDYWRATLLNSLWAALEQNRDREGAGRR